MDDGPRITAFATRKINKRYTYLVLVWSLIDTTSITSIQVEKCNKFSCNSFKTDIFQSE